MDKYLVARGYKKIFSTSGNIFIESSNEGRRVIMNMSTLINECKRRHDLFFDIIKKSSNKK
jgi:hypothetical protein